MQNAPVVNTSLTRGQRVVIERPWGIAAIAGFQLAKGILLMLTATLLRLAPNVVISSKSIFYPLLYIAMRGNMAAVDAATQGGAENDTLLMIVAGILFGLGAYIAAIGFGLWNVKQWARRSVMITSGLTVLLYIKTVLLPSAAAENSTGPTPSQPNMVSFYIVLTIDVLIFIYFMRSNTADVFKNNATH
ncbi:MAG TPA: hypothetical protein VGN16_19310 [Acidobacteriaceae bacterium]|jgi:hypothetical protein